MSTHLSGQDRAALQAALTARREQIRTRYSAHLAGQSRAEHAREVVDLAAIDAALARLDTDQYGLCTDCEAEIPLARLKLEPQALRCVACESRRERSQPRTSSM